MEDLNNESNPQGSEGEMTLEEIEIKNQLKVANKEALKFAYIIPGQTWPSELTWLFYAVGLRSTKHAEIGAWCGRSLIPVAAGMQFNDGGTIYAVDNFELTPEHDDNPNWVRSVLESTIQECKRLFPDVSIELIETDSILAPSKVENLDTCFIDAGHHYSDLAGDIQFWRSRINPEGLLCGHDYWEVHPGVMDAVNEFVPDFSVAPKTRIWNSEIHQKG